MHGDATWFTRTIALPEHSGPYAALGNTGFSASRDPTIPKNEPGHPIQHELTRSIPSSQCMVCHMHPGTNMVATYFGYTWWDNETDGEAMYPAKQHDPSLDELRGGRSRTIRRVPRRAASGRIEKFLEQTGSPEFNAQLKDTQFADFHGHGWIFRAVYKRDRKGNLLDKTRTVIPFSDEEQVCRKPCSSKTFISRRACTASIATSSRTVTATASCTARRAPRSRSIASIATAPSSIRRSW